MTGFSLLFQHRTAFTVQGERWILKLSKWLDNAKRNYTDSYLFHRNILLLSDCLSRNKIWGKSHREESSQGIFYGDFLLFCFLFENTNFKGKMAQITRPALLKAILLTIYKNSVICFNWMYIFSSNPMIDKSAYVTHRRHQRWSDYFS